MIVKVIWTDVEQAFVKKRVLEDKVHPYDVWQELLSLAKSAPDKYHVRTLIAIKGWLKDHGINWSSAAKRGDVKKKLTPKQKVKKDVKEAKLKQKLKEVEKKYEFIVKEESLADKLTVVLTDEIRALPSVKQVWTPPVEEVSQETAGLLFSDSHIGEVVDKDEVAGFGEYNFDIFARRLKLLFNSIKSIVSKKLLGYRIDKLCIFGLGDMVSGRIHDELIETGENIAFQAINGAFVTSQFILGLSKMFKEIEIDGVVGNHGRLTKKPPFKRKYVNWDYMFYQMLGMFLAKNERIKCHFPMSFFWVKKIYDWNFLMLHGDNIRSWFQIPWYGIERAMWKLGDLLQGRGINIDYRVLGHFHRTGELDRGPGEVLLNGSIRGGSEHSLGSMFEFDRPTQLFFGVHREIGTTWRYPLRLDLPELETTEPYEYNSELDAAKYMKKLLKE